MVELKIPGEGDSLLILKVPAALSDVDDESNLIQVQASAGAWTGKLVDLRLKSAELSSFITELGVLIESQNGDAHLETEEGEIDVQIEAATKGRFVVAGYISTGLDRQVTLEFAFETDLKSLSPLVPQLKQIN